MDRSATLLGAALRDVTARYPGRDVHVHTDGRATDQDALAAARALAGRGGRVFPVVPDPAAADVGVVAVALHPEGEGLRAEVELSASVAGPVEVRLLRDGRIVARRTMHLEAGARGRLTLRDPDAGLEGTRYRVLLVPDRGTPNDDPGNDAIDVAHLRGRRRVLVWGDLAADALGSEHEVTVVDRMRREELEGRDLVVLSNVPIAELRPHGVALLRFVATGGRLLVLGGPDAYAGGGWSGSAFERDLLPLRVRVPDGEGLALLLLIDRSGSTADEALGWLRDAALQTVAGVVPGERVAVLPFAATPDVALLRPGFVGAEDTAKRATLAAAVQALRARGDTDIPAALEAAAGWFASVSAQVRRVVLLTDGDPDKALDASALLRARDALVAADVEFGAVVVRMQKAVEQLRALAQRPDDVVYLREATRIPDALAHALASQRGRQERIERPSAPQPLPGGAALAPLAALRLTWMHDVEARDEARVLATAGAQAGPFAAARAVGAGEVLALAWGPEAEPAGAGRRAATEALRVLIQAMAQASDRGLAASFEQDDLVVRAPPGLGRMPLIGRDASNVARERAILWEVAPGAYRAREPAGAPASGWWVRLRDRPAARHASAKSAFSARNP